MNFPSRGLRLSATTIRYTGVFFAPTRFNRILTAINKIVHFPKRSGEISPAGKGLQALFYLFYRKFCRPPSAGVLCSGCDGSG